MPAVPETPDTGRSSAVMPFASPRAAQEELTLRDPDALIREVIALRRDLAFLAGLLELGGNATAGELGRRRKIAARYLGRRFGR